MSVFFASVLPVMILMCGLALDVGLMQMKKIQLQSAADSAAIAAELAHEREDTAWTTQSKDDAGLNGFTDGSNGVAVTVSEPPTQGSYAGYYDAIAVTVSQSMQTVFMGALNHGTVSLSAQSVSLMTPCVYITNSHTPNTVAYSLYLQQGSSMGYWGGSTMGCPVYVGKSIGMDSISSLWNNATNIAGASGSSVVTNAFHAPRFNATAMSDPLASVAQPSFSSCTWENKTWATGSTLTPGTYCNSFNFTNETITLNPGLYIITGGGTWTNSTVTGNGVTLFFTTGGGSSYGQFKVTSSAVTLSAPSSASGGSIPGIVLFGDRNWVPTGNQDFQFASGTLTGDGIYYTTGTGIFIYAQSFSGNNYLSFVTDSMFLYASAVKPLSNFSSLATGNPFRKQGVLVE